MENALRTAIRITALVLRFLVAAGILRITVGVAVHALIFVVAACIFFFGLGVGLSTSPAIGTLIWAAAVVVVLINIAWMVRKPLWRRT